MTKTAFIGFGEAGGLLTVDLSAAGAVVAASFDILINNADLNLTEVQDSLPDNYTDLFEPN